MEHHHPTIVELSRDEVKAYLDARRDEHLSSGRYTEGQALDAKMAAEAARLKAGAWSASCECSWSGNNPYPDRSSAEESHSTHAHAEDG